MLTIQGYHNLPSAPLQKGQLPKKSGDRQAGQVNKPAKEELMAKKVDIEDKDVEVGKRRREVMIPSGIKAARND